MRWLVPRDGRAHVSGGAGEDFARGGGGEHDPAMARWHTCSLCEHEYHGVVRGALGWACWKTTGATGDGRDAAWRCSERIEAGRYADSLSVMEAQLSLYRRIGASEHNLLEDARVGDDPNMLRNVYSGRLRLNGEEHFSRAANNYADLLNGQRHFKQAKSLLRKTMPSSWRES